MAEVEYKGIKIGGSKLLLILPLLGTIIGGLWGGFELYNRLLTAEKKLNELDPAAIQAEVQRLESVYDVIREDLKDSIDEAVTLARDVEKSSAATQREIRNDVYEMEREMQGRFREMDADIRANKKELEEKMQTILENPLNDVE
jgi:hypothetical protein|tara:strand:+ start:1854 stop:2285 length:432 start_codon:yes stop_codon:yes gene_type:complete